MMVCSTTVLGVNDAGFVYLSLRSAGLFFFFFFPPHLPNSNCRIDSPCWREEKGFSKVSIIHSKLEIESKKKKQKKTHTLRVPEAIDIPLPNPNVHSSLCILKMTITA